MSLTGLLNSLKLNRYLSTDDCSLTYYYSCETAPLTLAPDYPCPDGFYPYKDECFNPNQLTTDYDTATVRPTDRGLYFVDRNVICM
jgi:hypothetical protein